MAIRLTVERERADQKYEINMMAGNSASNNWVGGPVMVKLDNQELSGYFDGNKMHSIRQDIDYTGPITYTLFYDSEMDTVSAYAEMEDELIVIANGEAKRWEQKHVAGLYMFVNQADAGTITIREIEFFEAEKGMLDRLWEGMTREALLGISTGKLSKDVQLPSVAPAAPEIPLSWSLEKEDYSAAYIDENNVLKVNVSDVKNGGTTNLIATATIPGGGEMTKKFNIGVPYRSEPYCAGDEDIIYQENFDGKTELSQVNGVLETAGEMGNVFLSDGKLHIRHTNSGIAEDAASIYFHTDKSGTLGRIALEYEVTKTNATHVTLQTVGPNNDPYLGVWNMNHYGTDQTRYYTSSGNLNDWNRTEKTLSSLYFREKGP